ncbi:hypothetical protein Hanom_Chr12g01123771 [Helianthus anomalus]
MKTAFNWHSITMAIKVKEVELSIVPFQRLKNPQTLSNFFCLHNVVYAPSSVVHDVKLHFYTVTFPFYDKQRVLNIKKCGFHHSQLHQKLHFQP